MQTHSVPRRFFSCQPYLNSSNHPIMKTSLLKFAGPFVLLFAAFALTSSAIAVPITGSIYIDWNPGEFASITPTTIDFPAGPNGHVTYTEGDYSAVPFDSPATFFDITYSPAPLTGELWEIGGVGTSFWTTSFNAPIIGPNGGGILSGMGIAYLPGHDATAGEWTLALTNNAGKFSWVSTTTATNAVPEAGLTAAMLGLGLLGLGYVSRRQKRA